MAHRIWPGTRALAQLHLDQGQRVWLVTAAPIEIAQIIARRLGLTGALGTVAEHVDGVYTGRLVGDMLHGPAKARGGQGARRPRGARPGPLLGVLRLLQRPADAVPGRRPVRDQPRRPAARRTPGRRAGGSATTAPGARRPGPGCSPPPSPARSTGAVAAGVAVRRRPLDLAGVRGMCHSPVTDRQRSPHRAVDGA